MTRITLLEPLTRICSPAVFVMLLFFVQPMQAQSLRSFPVDDGHIYIGPFQFDKLTAIEPPPEFLAWWSEMKACTGIKAVVPEEDDFNLIGWFFADGIYKWRESLLGIYFEIPPEIIINPPEIVAARDSTPRLFEDIIKHEILHHLLYLQHGPVKQQPFKMFTYCLPLADEYRKYHYKDAR